jgi:hypothetical protein
MCRRDWSLRFDGRHGGRHTADELRLVLPGQIASGC